MAARSTVVTRLMPNGRHFTMREIIRTVLLCRLTHFKGNKQAHRSRTERQSEGGLFTSRSERNTMDTFIMTSPKFGLPKRSFSVC